MAARKHRTAPRTRQQAPADERIFAPQPGDLQQLPAGDLEAVGFEAIAGWAWDPQAPDQAVEVEVLDGDEVVLRVQADVFRQDLLDAGIGNGRHAFSISGHAALFPYSRHRVTVRRAGDGRPLPGSPKWLLRPELGLDAAALQFIESVIGAEADGQRPAAELDQQLAVVARLLNRLFNARCRLGGANGAHSAHLQELLSQAALSDWTLELAARVRSDYPPLAFERPERPRVSVIIPVYGKFAVTYKCLQSIAENPPKTAFEIVLVDDASPDETVFAGMVFGGVRLLRNAANLGFVRSCNAGAAAAAGELLFFLNNDTLVKPGWLDELVETFERSPDIGVAGSKLLFENGKLQEAGGIIWRFGDGWNWGREGDPEDPRYCFMRDCDYVSGAALMIRREQFQRLGGFDERYVPAYYEDTDLCFRVRAAGQRVVVQPASEIVHLEGISSGTDVGGSGVKRYQRVNQRKFHQRWQEVLARHRLNGQEPELEAERGAGRRAFFIDDTVPTPDQDAGSNAALQHMLALMRLGYKVVFIPADNMARIDPYTRNLQKLGIECLHAPYYWSVEEAFRRASRKPDLVYLHRYSNASKYATLARRNAPDCRIVYNVADLHFLRQQRELQVEGRLTVDAVSEKDELGAMQQVDAVVVHSSVEAALLRRRAPALQVCVVPWTFALRPCPTPLAARQGYAFVGSYGHRPNVDAALLLAHEIVPALRRLRAGITGHLVGSNAPQAVRELEAPDLRVLGLVPDLTGLLHRLRLTVAPLRYGAGLKGKVLDSLAHGLPCVMSEIAAEGLPLDGELRWLVARTPRDFARKIAALHDDEPLNQRLAALGQELVAAHYGAETVQKLLLEAITPAAAGGAAR